MSESDRLPPALLLMTAITGVVDAVSFLGLGRVFTANMTGNVVLLGFAVAGTPGLSVSRSVVALLAFFLGAVMGGCLGASMAVASRRRWLVTAGISETVLLGASAIVAAGSGTELPAVRLYALIVLTAVAMGIRNATVRRLAVPDLTTTVLTLTITAVAADSSLAGGDNPRLGRRLTSIAAMLAGAAIGAWLLQHGLALPLVVSAIGALVVTVMYRTLPAPTSP